MAVRKKWAAALCAVCLLAAFLAVPLPVAAAGNYDVHEVAVTVDLEEDGGAVITEEWDLTVYGGITEWYLKRVNFDESEISEFSVSDENGTQFENVGAWDVNRSIDEKAYQCGEVWLSDGAELCWGVGSTGRHRFTARYHMTNVVKGYADAAVILQVFVAEVDVPIEQASVTIRYDRFELTEQNTGVWGAGTTGEIYVREGVALATTTEPMQPGSTLECFVQFAEGMFQPRVQRSQTFEEVKREALRGTDYESGYMTEDTLNTDAGVVAEEWEDWQDGDDYYPEYTITAWDRFRWWLDDYGGMILSVVLVGAFVALFAWFSRVADKNNSTGARHMKPEYRTDQVDYSRALPWRDNMHATWARLKELRQEGNDGNIIGAYLLQWIRTRQVEIVAQESTSLFGKTSSETSIKLYSARPAMSGSERTLYDMLVSAAGRDYILQNKEFEKWSKKNYTKVDGWLDSYRNEGKQAIRVMGATTDEATKVFFGLLTSTKTVYTPLGEQLTREMFGFKKYLKDFTIINEREAREVQLWDRYLIYAQLFGIADEVAQQFKQLYPDYFVQAAQQMGTSVDMFDIMMINHITRSFSHAMYTGYRAGYNASRSSSSFSGGGGGFSGGGGRFSGSSGGGSSSGGR
ncbi:MAG: DUF2207 domain-containing protein [Oscillospiraceae bacterium]